MYMHKQYSSEDLRVQQVVTAEKVNELDDRIDRIEDSIAALAVLVNAVRDCVDTQISIFNA